ncbi:MAG: hypothetical protein A2622_04575 [Bdellovibrionales bacterium RIFCSPHIGHO2_01_FULL_40_29]|nr:MAG: hypothetical protein A2622_04575 [Bdellovibrionales bacterium RIFCSPHIGHO2_01_FULL_40_29]OFZ34790.1 MAG: hypothetical protein A3D17_10800 [Bdellovibrionales bacterium RIFCSPHIGHO2_02_FULL_40_15]
MKILLLSLSLFIFTNMAQAQSCNIKLQGGIDTWPWQVAQPFPWNNIQGVWKLDSETDSYFKMRVTGQNKKGKILNITKYTIENCNRPIATGVGFVDSFEKNIVRGIISDKTLRYQMTLGFFNPKQLAEDSPLCEDQVLAASIEVIGQKGGISSPIDPGAYEIELMVLKKVSNSLDFYCRGPAAH